MYTENVKAGQATQILYYACDDETTIKRIYTELTNSPILPKIKVATASDGIYSGIYWDISLNADTLYTPYGRFFHTTEMESGATTALLSTGFVGRLAPENIDSIWETGIVIEGIHFEAIGNYFCDWEDGTIPEDIYKIDPLPTSVAIPLETYFAIGLSPTRFRCVFAQPLTSTQIIYIENIMQSAHNIYALSLPQEYDTDAINAYVNELIPYLLIIVLALISIVSVILYWLRREFTRYRTYLICGSRGGQIAFMLSLNTTLLVTTSYASAYLVMMKITEAVPDGLISPLPMYFHCAIYFCALLITLLTVNMKAFPIVFQKKML